MNGKLKRKRVALIVAGAAVVTAGTVGAATALAGGDDDARDQPIPAAELERAERGALEEIGEGTVTGTEVDDEESKYEVEVTLDNGRAVDVQLDEGFHVVGTEADGEEEESGPDQD